MQDAVSDLLRILLLRAGVKMALLAAHFHGFGVAQHGPWNTRVNKGYKKRRKSGACDKPRSSATIGALECCWFSSGSLVVYLEEPHLPL
jgi:hypothetical protein